MRTRTSLKNGNVPKKRSQESPVRVVGVRFNSLKQHLFRKTELKGIELSPIKFLREETETYQKNGNVPIKLLGFETPSMFFRDWTTPKVIVMMTMVDTKVIAMMTMVEL